MLAHAERQRTDDTHQHTGDGDDQGGTLTGDAHLFLQEGRAHLVERHERCQRSHREQGIEKDGDDVTQTFDVAKGLLEHVRQGDEDQRGTAVGTDTHGEGSWEDDQTGQQRHEEVDDANLHGRGREVGVTGEITGVGADATHGDAQRIERLSQGTQEHVARDLREIWFEEKLDTLVGIRQHTRGPHDDDQ